MTVGDTVAVSELRATPDTAMLGKNADIAYAFLIIAFTIAVVVRS